LVRNFNFWKKHGIPYEKPLPFVGNLKEAALQTLCVGQNLKKIYDTHKDKPYVGFFSFDQPCLLINDPELVKCVLVKDAQNFMNRFQTADQSADFLTAKAVFALRGIKWKHVRLSITPVFLTGRMKIFCQVDECAKKLSLYLEENTAGGKFSCLLINWQIVVLQCLTPNSKQVAHSCRLNLKLNLSRKKIYIHLSCWKR
jgi:cytochrome P450 family 9